MLSAKVRSGFEQTLEMAKGNDLGNDKQGCLSYVTAKQNRVSFSESKVMID